MKQLKRSFFERSKVTHIARELVGKLLVTHIDGESVTGRIVETEAYAATGDKACHAHLGRFTERTKTMYKPGGTAYIYLCYGIHHLFNVVTNVEGTPEAVLIRAVEPISGLETMMERRGLEKKARNLTAGPGVMSQAMGITTSLNETDLTRTKSVIRMYDDGFDMVSGIETGPRVGIDYAGEDALLPWRFSLKGSKWKSPAK